MQKITFVTEYKKLWGQREAILLAVEDIHIGVGTPPQLLQYDTTKADGTRYDLKPGNHLLLIFLGNLSIPFTTIRARRNRFGDKKEYYESLIGKDFKIIIRDEE